jgi:hypothetical protein
MFATAFLLIVVLLALPLLKAIFRIAAGAYTRPLFSST